MQIEILKTSILSCFQTIEDELSKLDDDIYSYHRSELEKALSDYKRQYYDALNDSQVFQEQFLTLLLTAGLQPFATSVRTHVEQVMALRNKK